MSRMRRAGVLLLMALVALAVTNCASVPKETVELSYMVGEDMEAIYTSYKVLVRHSFANIRLRGLEVIDQKFVPAYLNEFARTGGLIEAARDSQMERVEFWARLAVTRIDSVRKAFVDPVNAQEDSLITLVDNAFASMLRANAALTAHLQSVTKVQDLQDDVLQAMRVKDLRDRINNGLVKASNLAAAGTQKVEAAAAAFQKIP